jgi:glycerophosphoryl diester phosphodiesterase
MEIIAHRGGTFGKENSLETIIASAKMGAYAVECDIRKTIDGVYVIYHDDDLSRLAGVPAKVSESTYEQMQEYHVRHGLKVLTFEELKSGYKESTPILLHIKLVDYDMDFAKYVCESGLPIIAGVMSLDMLMFFCVFTTRTHFGVLARL